MSSYDVQIQARPTVEELIERNKRYATTSHKAIPSLMARTKNNPKLNGPHVVIISCLDSRSNPFDFLELELRECLVIRNVAGRFASAASDIAALDSLFHVSQIVIVHHSNCGASHVTTQNAMEAIRGKRPDFPSSEYAGLAGRMPFKQDNDKSLQEDFEAAKRCGFLRKDLVENIVGIWLDVESGLITRVYPEN